MRMGRITSSICQALGLPCYYYYYSPSPGPEAVTVINVMAGLVFCSGHNSRSGVCASQVCEAGTTPPCFLLVNVQGKC